MADLSDLKSHELILYKIKLQAEILQQARKTHLKVGPNYNSSLACLQESDALDLLLEEYDKTYVKPLQ